MYHSKLIASKCGRLSSNEVYKSSKQYNIQNTAEIKCSRLPSDKLVNTIYKHYLGKNTLENPNKIPYFTDI